MAAHVIGYPTWKKYKCIGTSVSRMSIREKRHIFSLMRSQTCSHDMLLVGYGITLGDFCCMNTLNETKRRE